MTDERCVMCGGKMHPGPGHKMGPKDGGPWVVCEDCGAQAPLTVTVKDERTDADPLQEAIDWRHKPVEFWECGTCGALVVPTAWRKHLDWHT